MDCVSTRKAINRIWSNEKPHHTLKTKMINNFKKIQIDQNTMRTNGQSSGQLFLRILATQQPKYKFIKSANTLRSQTLEDLAIS